VYKFDLGIVRSCKELEALIKKDGWKCARQDGSHKIFKYQEKKGTVTIPNKDLKKGTANNILKQAGLK